MSEVRPVYGASGGAAGGAGGAQASPQPVLACHDLRRVYTEEDGSELTILDGVNLAVPPGQAVAVVGASGAGKSTLLHILGLLDRPTAGRVLVDGRDMAGMAPAEMAAVRNRRIGFVFQFHHLLREFTALENVMMPQLIAGTPERAAAARARELLDQVGLAARMTHQPHELSGGEQQRVAVARALANRPAVVLADEPSGNLDVHTSETLHDIFFGLRDEHGVALVIATHDRDLAGRADRIMLVEDGRLNEKAAA